MELKSALTLQQIYNLTPTPNVLIYGDYKIPCICKFVENNLIIDCRMEYYFPFVKEINEEIYIKIENLDFYIADRKDLECEVGEVVKWNFKLISEKPIEIRIVDLPKTIFNNLV